MKNLVEWLSHIEKMSASIYKEAAVIFKEDKDFSQVLHHLAEDETWHFHVMERAAKFLQGNTELHADVALDADMKASVEVPLLENRKKIAVGALTKESLLKCIVSTEFSEWNEIFLYVVDTLKNKNRRFEYIASKIEHHKKFIEQYLETQPDSYAYLDKIRRLPEVWKIKILIVEDYEPLRDLLSVHLSKKGAVEKAANGKQGLLKVLEQYYDVIISDSVMPVMSGIEFYKQAVLHDPLIAERFVLIMDSPVPEDIVYVSENNVRYVRKPFTLYNISEAVREILTRTHPKDIATM